MFEMIRVTKRGSGSGNEWRRVGADEAGRDDRGDERDGRGLPSNSFFKRSVCLDSVKQGQYNLGVRREKPTYISLNIVYTRPA